MTIEKLVRLRLKLHPWPEKAEIVGPGTCGPTTRKCQTAHAYAHAVFHNVSRLPDGGSWVWVFDRPCNLHDQQRRRKLGIVKESCG